MYGNASYGSKRWGIWGAIIMERVAVGVFQGMAMIWVYGRFQISGLAQVNLIQVEIVVVNGVVDIVVVVQVRWYSGFSCRRNCVFGISLCEHLENGVVFEFGDLILV